MPTSKYAKVNFIHPLMDFEPPTEGEPVMLAH